MQADLCVFSISEALQRDDSQYCYWSCVHHFTMFCLLKTTMLMISDQDGSWQRLRVELKRLQQVCPIFLNAGLRLRSQDASTVTRLT